ncbi:cytochrome c oxidase subunit II [Sphingomonas nostoxanthinifaciens]|uniref:cytochrome c oxidase subunit II n=1 Tax=Sphingomonas nostoxanthinifaciens TaxID=2872652 RepID=UPI001CC1EE33|nr:cytochrome c oxidase subunit II [Sphingomonas nostoxanthinifaciens]
MFKTIRGLTLGIAAACALGGAAGAQAPNTLPNNPLPIVTPNPGTVAPTPAVVSVAAKPGDIVHVAPTPGIGQPTDAVALQPQETAIGQEAARMHNFILMPVMTIICVLVLVLLGWVALRYRAAANPVPSKTHHNTVIEVIWTLAPVLILVLIAVPSIKLIAHQYAPPKADLTVKVVGNQWYWEYQYPDNGNLDIVSNMLPEAKDAHGKRSRTDVDGPRLLAVDERMVVPAGAVVKIITTSNDVIHSFALPAAWVKMDAVPGRLNETWFKIDRPGVYFGQCSELCGARHGFMPIAVEVVPPAQFAQWIAFKGGTMPGAKPAASPDATSPASPAVSGPPAATAGVPTDATVPGTGAKVKPSAQSATAQN